MHREDGEDEEVSAIRVVGDATSRRLNEK